MYCMFFASQRSLRTTSLLHILFFMIKPVQCVRVRVCVSVGDLSTGNERISEKKVFILQCNMCPAVLCPALTLAPVV